MKINRFFESSVDMLCIANYDGYFVDVNPAFIRLLGYTLEELFSRKINEFVYEEDKDSTQRVREAIYDNEPLINFQNRYVCKSGDLVWLSWSAVPVVEDRLVYAIAKDITHEQHLRNERIKEMVKLKTVNANLLRLNYTTSHDLRAPVNNLISLFEILDLNQIKDKETIELLKFMEISAKGVKESLENYLDLMQHASADEEQLSVVSFEESLSKTRNTLSCLLMNSKTNIQSDFSACESVIFNKEFLDSIFLNLLTNSVKYAKPGFSPVVEIASAIRDGKNVLRYKDYGVGFDMDKNGDKIFGLHQRFSDIEDSKGVGLYLIKTQINSVGGTITVESEPNQGATFTITFPN